MSEAERWVDDNIPNALYMKKFIVRGYNAGYHARDSEIGTLKANVQALITELEAMAHRGKDRDAEIERLRAENADMKEICKDRARHIVRRMELEAGIREIQEIAGKGATEHNSFPWRSLAHIRNKCDELLKGGGDDGTT